MRDGTEVFQLKVMKKQQNPKAVGRKTKDQRRGGMSKDSF